MPESRPVTRSERAHYVRSPAPWAAGCSDAGLRHATNQDAMCLAVREKPSRAAVLALSDGVTTAEGSELASVLASETAVDHLVARLDDGAPYDAAFGQAFAAAHQAVLEAHDEPSACTLIAALIHDGGISVGNVGDSRAYWIGDDGTCTLLSTDDSMAQARIMLGMTRTAAERSSQAHALTKWLGRQSTDVAPSVVTVRPTGDGWLMICTDGLWNYASPPESMGPLFNGFLHDGSSPAHLAESLVGWANAQGGKDNVTVVVARVEAA